VGAAVEAGLDAGRPHRIRVTHFAEQLARKRIEQRLGRAIVQVAFGEGLATVFREAGAHVVMAGPAHRPNTTELYEAVVGTGAAEVVLVPNARDIATSAEAAASRAQESGDQRVAVVPSYSQVQGLAALAVHDPGRSFGADLVEMIAASSHARSGAVTIADKQAITMGGPCEPGDVLGVVEGDFAIVGSDLFDVAKGVLDKMLGGGGELVTVLAGAGGAELAQRCVDYLAEAYVTVDVVSYTGGQQRYAVLFGVE
ncbi:MAG: Dak phosphatase, partial [Nocardioidaceae bacterium]